MSHLRERSQTNCLNCNAELIGKYCHICGQENIHPEESAWHLVTHFFNDVTHFDGKFFSTLKFLVTKPGFLSMEYKLGRRSSYLNPIRMYIFTSAVFFLFFFSVNHLDRQEHSGDKENRNTTIAAKKDTSEADGSGRFYNGQYNAPDGIIENKDSLDKYQQRGIHFFGKSYKNRDEFDSAVKAGEHFNWFERKIILKQIDLNERYKDDRAKFGSTFLETMLHSFPQMLFISLPILALLFRLLYWRRKDFYYASHAIFSVHLYIFIFIMLFITIVLSQLNDSLHWEVFNYIIPIPYLAMFYYSYKAMRNFYRQGRGKTILKFILLNLMMLIVMIVLLFASVLYSFYKI